MFYFKASINIVDGKKTYGDLPENYTVAHENESTQTAYFPMVNKLDEKYAEVAEIDKEEYDQALSDINGLVREKRRVEFEETKAKVLEKQKVIDDLNKTVVLLESENLSTMVAVAEVYEKNVLLELENAKLKEDNLASMDAIAQLYEMQLGGV